MRPKNAEPVAALARELLGAFPPSLRGLLEALEEGHQLLGFIDLVETYLPERRAEILAVPHEGGRIEAFANHFGDRYFPLHPALQDAEGLDFGYGDLLATIPLIPRGVGWGDLHEPQVIRAPIRAIGCLVFQSIIEDIAPGVGIAWLEECEGYLSPATLVRLGSGYTVPDLMYLLQGTWAEGAAWLARWLSGDTDNYFLDTDEESLGETPWDPETVASATDEWLAAEGIMQQVDELAQWLDEEPDRRFNEVLDFLEQRLAERGRPDTPPDLPLVAIFGLEENDDDATETDPFNRLGER